jgi:hypothetical protein
MTRPESAMRPNLFVVGAMKCGTTSFHGYLAQHPAILMSEVKEPCHFIHPQELRAIWPQMHARGFADAERYLSLFAAEGDYAYRGESSTDYAKWPLVTDVPERIRAFSPEARIMFLFRDPLQRAVSHYWHNVYYGRETRPIEAAVEPASEYVLVSCYAAQMRRFVDVFGADRILALRSESLSREPERVLKRCWSWLGLDADVAVDASERRHVSPEAFALPKTSRKGLGRLLSAEALAPVRRLAPSGLRRTLRRGLGLEEDRRRADLGFLAERIAPLLAGEARALEAMLEVVA